MFVTPPIDPAWGVDTFASGPPDLEHPTIAIWLIVRGPPFAMRFARYLGSDKPEDYDFYHRHDTVDSIHVIVRGRGFYAVGGTEHELAAGMVVHHARGVPHCGPFPHEGGMDMLVIQIPTSGHASDFIVCPDSGLRGAYGDKAAFVAKYGDQDLSGFGKLLLGGAKKSQKWIDWHRT